MAAGKDSKIIYASQAQLYEKALQKMNADTVIVQHAYKAENYSIAAAMFEEVGDYLDARELAQRCRTLAEETKADELETLYQRCADRIKDPLVYKDSDKLRKLISQLETINGYKDAGEMLKDCKSRLQKKDRKRKIKIRTTLAVLVLLIILGIEGLHTGFIKYYAGIAMLKYGKAETAEKVFRSLAGYKDADEYLQQAEMTRFKYAKAGETVSFGDFKWLILDVQKNVTTMIAVEIEKDHMFYSVPFNEEGGETTWEDSSLRNWLNNEVYETCFSDNERMHMLSQTCERSENPEYGTSYEGTEEYLSILSVEQADMFKEELGKLSLDFWVRTPGDDMSRAVYYSGGAHIIRLYGCPVESDQVAVRPVIRVDRSGF